MRKVLSKIFVLHPFSIAISILIFGSAITYVVLFFITPKNVGEPIAYEAPKVVPTREPSAKQVVVPNILGMSPQAAQEEANVYGLQLHLLVINEQIEHITAQYPEPGSSISSDMPLEARIQAEHKAEVLNDTVSDNLATPLNIHDSDLVGQMPSIDVASLPKTSDRKDSEVPNISKQPEYKQPKQPAPNVPQSLDIRYILPPSQGMLRINPLRLPALPAGTLLEGTASWYGAEEHGTTTACMVTYNMYAATLATREIPCGTEVLVIAQNGKAATAITTDWGPAEWTGRRFDLSPVVFEQLAPLSSGVIPVQIVTLAEPRKLEQQ